MWKAATLVIMALRCSARSHGFNPRNTVCKNLQAVFNHLNIQADWSKGIIHAASEGISFSGIFFHESFLPT